MRLYHSPLSFNARRALLAAYELGLDPDLALVDLGKGEQRAPAFLRLNPAGKVPVLDDEGTIVLESHAIMQYLADRTPGQTLYPTALGARAQVNRWLFWSAQHFAPSVAILNWERVVKRFLGLGEPEPALVAKGTRDVSDCANLLDQVLAERTFLAGDDLTLADLAVAAPLITRAPAALPIDGFAHLAAWFERVSTREAWQRAAAPGR